MKETPVLIVSAFGRGQSLAARLRSREIPVTLLDVTEFLGATAPEDEEGPFGLFLSGLSEMAQERIHQDDPLVTAEQGWTLVLRSGPLSMKGPLTKNRLEKLGLNEELLATLKQGREPGFKSAASHLQRPFDQVWLLELAQSLASNTDACLSQAVPLNDPLPLDRDFATRPATRPGLQQSLKWCERRGVEVIRGSEILDVAREGRQYKGLQLKPKSTPTSEILGFEKLVWCLTSEETFFLSEDLGKKLFPEGALKPTWVWTRFRLRIPESPERRVLPNHSVWIQDLDLPWTHENLVILSRSPSPDLFDAWIRVPADQRLQKSDLLNRFHRILENLSIRFPTTKPVKAEEPLSSEKSYREVGPPRHPLFSSRELLAWRGGGEFELHSPEVWAGLGWNNLFQYEEKAASRLEAWWKKREEQRLKREQKGKAK